eukprot:gene5013-10028_t
MDDTYDTFRKSCIALSSGVNVELANSFLLSLIDNDQCWHVCIRALSSKVEYKDYSLQFFAATLLHSSIRKKWEYLENDERAKIQEIVITTLYGLYLNESIYINVRNQLCVSTAAIIARHHSVEAIENIASKLCANAEQNAVSAMTTLCIFRDIPREYHVYMESLNNSTEKQQQQIRNFIPTAGFSYIRRTIISAVATICRTFLTAYSNYQHNNNVVLDVEMLYEGLLCLSSWCSTELKDNEIPSTLSSSSNQRNELPLLFQDCCWISLRDLVMCPSSSSTSSNSPSANGEDCCLMSILMLVKPLATLGSSGGEDSDMAGSCLQTILQILLELLMSPCPSDELAMSFQSSSSPSSSSTTTTSLSAAVTLASAELQVFITVTELWSILLGDVLIWRQCFLNATTTVTLPLEAITRTSTQGMIYADNNNNNNIHNMNNNRSSSLYGVLTSLQSYLHCSPLYALNDGPALLVTMVEVVAVLAEKHSNARSVFKLSVTPDGFGTLLTSIMMVIAALPDLSAMTAVVELFVYCVELIPQGVLEVVTLPIFDILCYQLRIPLTVSDDTFLAFREVFSSGGSMNLSQDVEDTLSSVLEFRREASEVLFSLWRKWPGGLSIPDRLLSVLTTQWNQFTHGEYGVTISSQAYDENTRLIEALVFVLGRLLEGAEGLYFASLEDDVNDEEGQCNQKSALLPGCPISNDTLGFPCNGSRTGMQSELELWFVAAGWVSLQIASMSMASSSSSTTSTRPHPLPLLSVQATEMWTYAAAVLRPIFDSYSDNFIVSYGGLEPLSSEWVIRAVLRLCCDSLLLSPIIASKAWIALPSSMKCHLSPFAADIHQFFIETIQQSSLGMALIQDKQLSERLYTSLALFTSNIPEVESRHNAVQRALHIVLSNLMTAVEKLNVSCSSRDLTNMSLWIGWSDVMGSNLAAMRGLIQGFRNEPLLEGFLPQLSVSVLDTMDVLGKIGNNNNTVGLSSKTTFEAIRLLDQSARVLCSAIERTLPQVILQMIIIRITQSLVSSFQLTGLATLVNCLITWTSDVSDLRPALANLIHACLDGAVRRLSRPNTSPNAKGAMGEYLGVCCRIIRQVARVFPAAFSHTPSTTHFSTDVLSPPSNGVCTADLVAELIVLVVNNDELISNCKLIRALAFAVNDVKQSDDSGGYAVVLAIQTRAPTIVGPVLWGVLFGVLDKTSNVYASLLECILKPHKSVHIAQQQHELFLIEVMNMVSRQICLSLSDEWSISLNKPDGSSSIMTLYARDVMEVVVLSFVRHMASGGSLKHCLPACSRLARNNNMKRDDFGMKATLASLCWPERLLGSKF